MTDPLFSPTPPGWTTSTLGELCARGGGTVQTGPFGSQLHASDYVAHGVPSVMPVNIGDNRIVASGIARVREVDAERLSRHRLRRGDIIYSRRGDVERRALVRQSEEGWLCGTGCLRVRPGTEVSSEWLSYYLGYKRVRDWILRHAVGATMPNLNTGILSRLPVTTPPRVYQEAVAEVLLSLDDKIEVNQRVAELCYRMLRTRLEVALSDSSASVRLSDIAVINARRVKPGPGTCRYVDISSLSSDSRPKGQVVRWEDAPSRARRGVRHGDILWSTVRPERRSHALVISPPADLVVSTGFAVLSPTNVGSATLYGLVTRTDFVEFLVSVSEGSAYPAVRADRFGHAVVPTPHPRVAEALEAELWALAERANAAHVECDLLIQLRDDLLPALMSGQLRVREAEELVEEAV